MVRIDVLRLENLLVVGADLDVDRARRVVSGEPTWQRENKCKRDEEGTRKHAEVRWAGQRDSP